MQKSYKFNITHPSETIANGIENEQIIVKNTNFDLCELEIIINIIGPYMNFITSESYPNIDKIFIDKIRINILQQYENLYDDLIFDFNKMIPALNPFAQRMGARGYPRGVRYDEEDADAIAKEITRSEKEILGENFIKKYIYLGKNGYGSVTCFYFIFKKISTSIIDYEKKILFLIDENEKNKREIEELNKKLNILLNNQSIDKRISNLKSILS